VKDDPLELMIARGHITAACDGSPADGPVTPGTLNGPGPACRFVNIELVGSTAEQGVMGTVLLENPRGKYIITYKELVCQVVMYKYLSKFGSIFNFNCRIVKPRRQVMWVFFMFVIIVCLQCFDAID